LIAEEGGKRSALHGKLVLERPGGTSVSFPLTQFPVALGREASNDITLSDHSVSRRHARLVLDGEMVQVEDLGSSNGTFVNGNKIASCGLKNGDHLRLGNCSFAVELDPPNTGKGREPKTTSSTWDLSTHSLSQEDLEVEATGIRAAGLTGASTGAVLGFFQQTGRILERAFDLDELLNGILDLTFQMIPAGRGCILLADPNTGEMGIKASKTSDDEGQDGLDRMKISRTILDYATRQGRAVLTSDATSDDRFGAAQSVIIQEIRGAMCVPLRGREEIIGAIYVDSKLLSHKFSIDDLKLLFAVGAQIGIAVENTRLYDANLRAERMAAVGQAVAGLGHCIKNILNGMEGGSFILQKGIDKAEEGSIRKGWDILSRNSSRLKDLVLDMLAYSKPREPMYQVVQGNSVVVDVVELLQERADGKGVHLRYIPDERLQAVEIDGKAIYRCVLNLVTNAIDACQEQGGEVCVRTLLSQQEQRFEISVSDNGCGVSEEDMEKLGRAFFSTKGSKGTGLGLSVTYKIVSEHKGDIRVESRLREGTTFTLSLPVRRPME